MCCIALRTSVHFPTSQSDADWRWTRLEDRLQHDSPFHMPAWRSTACAGWKSKHSAVQPFLLTRTADLLSTELECIGQQTCCILKEVAWPRMTAQNLYVCTQVIIQHPLPQTLTDLSAGSFSFTAWWQMAVNLSVAGRRRHSHALSFVRELGSSIACTPPVHMQHADAQSC